MLKDYCKVLALFLNRCSKSNAMAIVLSVTLNSVKGGESWNNLYIKFLCNTAVKGTLSQIDTSFTYEKIVKKVSHKCQQLNIYR